MCSITKLESSVILPLYNMETLDTIFCLIMNGLMLSVGPSCSGARTFIECLVVAAVCCLIDRAFSLRLFVVAAISAIIANALRCAMLLTWAAHGWENYEMAHDLGGLIIVVVAFVVIVLTPRKRRSK
jgi:exosortase/archaeosortase family protein